MLGVSRAQARRLATAAAAGCLIVRKILAAPTRRLSAKTADLRLGSRVLAFGKRGTITALPGVNGWWRVRLDGDSLTRSVRAGTMQALDGAVAPPRPSANELKLSEELAQLKRENERLKAPRGPSLPEAVDDATAQERNRRLAEEIGAPVCLWGATDVRR